MEANLDMAVNHLIDLTNQGLYWYPLNESRPIGWNADCWQVKIGDTSCTLGSHIPASSTYLTYSIAALRIESPHGKFYYSHDPLIGKLYNVVQTTKCTERLNNEQKTLQAIMNWKI